MPNYAIDVVVSPSAPVVDVTAVGVQGPPGVPGPPGPAGEPGPAGPAGTGNVSGPASATDNSLALFDGATGKLLDAGPDGKISGSVSIGTAPAQSGAVRLANGQEITARNDANTGDIRMMVSTGTGVVFGSLSGGQSYFDSGNDVVVRPNGAAAQFYLSATGIYPGADNAQILGFPTLRFSVLNLGTRINLKETTAPGAPGANEVNIWAEDNGAGKTRVMMQFATGAAMQIAIQP
jgi:hypothetical protein